MCDTGCGDGALAAPGIDLPKGNVDLGKYINTGAVCCLNADSACNPADVLGEELSVLRSDADEQLLFFIPFTSPVKLQGLVVAAPNNGSGPKTVKLFINRLNITFDDVDDLNETQAVTLTADQLEGKASELKFVKFQNVHNITVFIEDNQGDEEQTVLNRLAFIGRPMAGTNMSELK